MDHRLPDRRLPDRRLLDRENPNPNPKMNCMDECTRQYLGPTLPHHMSIHIFVSSSSIQFIHHLITYVQ